MITKTLIDIASQAAQTGQYEWIGLRVLTDGENYMAGDTADNSQVWHDGEPTGESLDGTSALLLGKYEDVDPAHVTVMVARAAKYLGHRVAVLGAMHVQGGEDRDEIVMRDAVVVAVIDR